MLVMLGDPPLEQRRGRATTLDLGGREGAWHTQEAGIQLARLRDLLLVNLPYRSQPLEPYDLLAVGIHSFSRDSTTANVMGGEPQPPSPTVHLARCTLVVPDPEFTFLSRAAAASLSGLGAPDLAALFGTGARQQPRVGGDPVADALQGRLLLEYLEVGSKATLVDVTLLSASAYSSQLAAAAMDSSAPAPPPPLLLPSSHLWPPLLLYEAEVALQWGGSGTIVAPGLMDAFQHAPACASAPSRRTVLLLASVHDLLSVSPPSAAQPPPLPLDGDRSPLSGAEECVVAGYPPALAGRRTFVNMQGAIGRVALSSPITLRDLVLYNLAPGGAYPLAVGGNASSGTAAPRSLAPRLLGADAAWANSSLPLWLFQCARSDDDLQQLLAIAKEKEAVEGSSGAALYDALVPRLTLSNVTLVVPEAEWRALAAAVLLHHAPNSMQAAQQQQEQQQRRRLRGRAHRGHLAGAGELLTSAARGGKPVAAASRNLLQATGKRKRSPPSPHAPPLPPTPPAPPPQQPLPPVPPPSPPFTPTTQTALLAFGAASEVASYDYTAGKLVLAKARWYGVNGKDVTVTYKLPADAPPDAVLLPYEPLVLPYQALADLDINVTVYFLPPPSSPPSSPRLFPPPSMPPGHPSLLPDDTLLVNSSQAAHMSPPAAPAGPDGRIPAQQPSSTQQSSSRPPPLDPPHPQPTEPSPALLQAAGQGYAPVASGRDQPGWRVPVVAVASAVGAVLVLLGALALLRRRRHTHGLISSNASEVEASKAKAAAAASGSLPPTDSTTPSSAAEATDPGEADRAYDRGCGGVGLSLAAAADVAAPRDAGYGPGAGAGVQGVEADGGEESQYEGRWVPPLKMPLSSRLALKVALVRAAMPPAAGAPTTAAPTQCASVLAGPYLDMSSTLSCLAEALLGASLSEQEAEALASGFVLDFNVYYADLRDGLVRRQDPLPPGQQGAATAAAQPDDDQARPSRQSHARHSHRHSGAAKDGAELSYAIRTLEAELRDPDLSLHGFLGRGAWGMVYGGTWRGLPVAVKVLVVPGMPAVEAAAPVGLGVGGNAQGAAGAGAPGGAKDLRVRQRAVLEVSISMSMMHPNVVATYTFELKPLVHNPQVPNPASGIDNPSAADAYKLYIVQELCNGGSLGSALAVGMAGSVLAGGTYRRLALRLAADVALGMAHVHSCRIVHGDLKPDNVLLMSGPRCEDAEGGSTGEGAPPVTVAPPDHVSWGAGFPAAHRGSCNDSGIVGSGGSAAASLQLTAKVADFGLSMPLEAGATHASRRFHGTPIYSAPEVVMKGRQSPQADVWSFGLILLELYYGCTLSYMRGVRRKLVADAHQGGSSGAGVAAKLEDILTEEIMNSPYRSYGDLAAACLKVDPRARPPFKELAARLVGMLEEENAVNENAKA